MLLQNLWTNETDDLVVSLRGGSSSSNSRSRQGTNPAENVVKGAQATLANTANFWSRTFASLPIPNPFSSLKRAFRSKTQQQEEELLHQLQTMPVRRVQVPNSTVLPPEVVQVAAKRSGMLGNPLRVDRVQELARTLQRWYGRQGYVLHSVTGATLRPETATAEIAVQEPKINAAPVGIVFCKEMVVDPNDENNLLTFRQYKDREQQKRAFASQDIQKKDLNTTFIETTGRTNPQRIAAALGLHPGGHFLWRADKWNSVSRSGIFKKILRASPQPMGDGTVQLQIYCQEAPPRHLEYGLGKSLYTNSWEGEMEFEHTNLLGGGETLGVTVKRGTHDQAPSLRVGFRDAKFGMPGGYDVQVFRDYLGGTDRSGTKRSTSAIKADTEATEVSVATAAEPDEAANRASGELAEDTLFDRKGLSFRIKNPVPQRLVLHSVASATVERTSTTGGEHENIASTTLSVGPFLRELPFDARSNVDAILTTGTRISTQKSEEATKAEESSRATSETTSSSFSFLDDKQFLPYTVLTATAKQLFPLTQLQQRRPLVLAMRHSVSTSSRHTPLYEAKALGNAASIRGAEPNGRVKSCLRGTTELRLPVKIPNFSSLLPKTAAAAPISQIRQDANVVLFGDWLVAAKDSQTPLFRKTSVGVGIRKSIQGIPLQIDLTYSKELKFKTAFGLGRDFDV